MYPSIATGEIVSPYQAETAPVRISPRTASTVGEPAERAAIATGWSEAWEVVIRYAGYKGWLSDHGRIVEVHVEH
ncbi:hypothetical protein ACFWIJ_05735 [Streptomyces sp. NPDC127079]|uniref:hypothetical protein n=1 Tax=Streptomyces sp. NPDC127079 TaxID=3347132 RepID=UPI003669C913